MKNTEKKVLLLGGVNLTADLVDLAHRNNIKIGVADYTKNSYLKKISDYAYDIDVSNIDEIIKVCNSEKYDGIISNFVDSISPIVSEIGEKNKNYVPYNIEQIKMSGDKRYFKSKCIEYEIDVPKEYSIDRTDEIIYPVIIKPVDGSGSKGITVCRCEEDLKEAYENAVMMSKSKNAIIEQFIESNEINITYIARNGKIELAAIHDRYFKYIDDKHVKVPDIYIYPSKYLDLYYRKYNEKVIKMLHGIGVVNGSLFIQACVKDETIYLYEAGMRLNGCKTYQILERENGFNTFEELLKYSITGKIENTNQLNPYFKKWYATLNILITPGETLDRIEGEEYLKHQSWFIFGARHYHPGETVPKNSLGTLQQIYARVHAEGNTKEELLANVNDIYRNLKVYNKDNQNILLEPHDLRLLMKEINYELPICVN